MCRIRFLALVLAFAVPTWSTSQAAGSFQTKPPFPSVVRAGMPMPDITLPKMSADDLVGGCGKGRVRDTGTHGCRGPANVR